MLAPTRGVQALILAACVVAALGKPGTTEAAPLMNANIAGGITSVDYLGDGGGSQLSTTTSLTFAATRRRGGAPLRTRS